MSDTARLAVFHGTGKPFEIREYPVPEPEPGAMLIRIALANVCGSDMHYWRGEQNYEKMGRPLPLNTGHEHVGTVAKLGPGVTTDSAGQKLAVGDRVLYRYFFPCGRCKACLRRQYKSCPVRQANWLVSCEVWPHFQGGFGQYFYLRPNHAVFKLTPEITDEMAAGINCAYTQVYAGLDIARAPGRPDRGGAGRRRSRRLRVRGGPRDGREPGDRDRRRGRAAGAGPAIRRHGRRRPARAQHAGRARRADQAAHRRLGRRRRARAGRASRRGRRGPADDRARGHVPRDRQHQRRLEGRVRSRRGSSSATAGSSGWPTTRPSTCAAPSS